MASFLKTIVWRCGFAIKETGLALETLGCKLQGNYSFREKLSRHTPLTQYQFKAPSVGESTFVAPSALVSGDVIIGEKSSVLYNAVVRGEFKSVTIGEGSTISDNAYVGSSSEFSPETVIGSNVSVGSGAVLKGCTVGNNVLIGNNVIISEKATVEDNTILAPGSYVPEDVVVKSGELWSGSPAQKLRNLDEKELALFNTLSVGATELAADHAVIMKLLELKQKEFIK
mmetsp:Transcript_20568/g.36918  ORF Transcript_20568/g.36918 Transcript_20568/m.36918 type:complete len:228 (-) Transcript_20568:575-1258(-)|eukprot:CAMPEP_0175045464 /NCGR_PEP_ID=MMETSP0052_2-20121109/4440_1 /TAXON_ID=51329 ORGANISM="Polytomella parva, Strain SAG 63-3" /NCGR_SAMPLE_ID=MMETSP0052_2 /ASSEMBLY_ACC=CAM_ASM_000194 /LENGTH=227 /DNA_ID=CAMNT_0016309003 /DNA_START=30 /DNA_END=713 /DNA_ORIENTATION=-